MECFTVRDGLSGENARFHEASEIIYLRFGPMIKKWHCINVYFAECIGQRRF